jgi:hypothetical protein
MDELRSTHGVVRNAYKFWYRNVNRRSHVEDIDVYGRIILK